MSLLANCDTCEKPFPGEFKSLDHLFSVARAAGWLVKREETLVRCPRCTELVVPFDDAIAER